MPQLQSSSSIYLIEFKRPGYKYPVAEVVFQGLGLGDKSGLAVAGYLIALSLLP